MNPRVARAALVALLLLTACSDEPATTPTPSLEPAFIELMASLTGDGDPAASPLDAFWHETLATYVTPASVTGYRAGEIPDATICGDHDDADSWRNNAFYCPSDQTITYDIDWFADLYRQAGALAPIGILAHEWGHHVQEQTDVGEYSIQDELMADCLAGMFASATDDGAANADQMVAFYALGNSRYQASTWFQAREHGSPNQRAAAWAVGYLNITGAGVGLPTCRGYAAWEPGKGVTLGEYRFVDLPGRVGVAEGGTYAVPPRAGLPGVSIGTFERPAGADPEALAAQLVAGLEQPVDVLPVEVTLTDAGAVYYTRRGADHGFVGVVAPPDAATALFILVQATTPLSGGETDTPEDVAASLAATNLGLIALGRVCAPGQSADGGTPSERFDAYCAADL